MIPFDKIIFVLIAAVLNFSATGSSVVAVIMRNDSSNWDRKIHMEVRLELVCLDFDICWIKYDDIIGT